MTWQPLSVMRPALASLSGRCWLAFVLAAALSGCATAGRVTGDDETTKAGGQSETDATTTFRSNVSRIVVAFNDETGNQNKIKYTDTTRKVLKGASLMGWSYSEDHGAHWKYGGKVQPPQGWAVLWGDPAMTTSRTNYGLAFMSNLAFPDAKFPAGGVDGLVYEAVGGACIARSTDGGVSFSIFQCVTNKDPIAGKPNSTKGHFYDGGSLAPGPQGEIYAAYVDVDNSQADIWRSADGNQPFSRLPPPFPNYYVGSHPRVRVGNDGTLFVMAEVKLSENFYALAANRYKNGAWGTPKLVTSAIAIYPNVDLGSQLLGSPLTLRTGPQFSFDLGTASVDLDDSVRFLVTQYNEKGWLFVRGGVCDYNLQSCGWYQGWTFGADKVTSQDAQRLDVFNPNVAAFPGSSALPPDGRAHSRRATATAPPP